MSYNADSIIRLPILSGRIPKEKQDEIKEKSDPREVRSDKTRITAANPGRYFLD